jgi:predicted Fe-Mo cluster-binding NifX family protein
MRIAVTATGPTLDHEVYPRVGRCPYFLLVETDDMSCEALSNPMHNAKGCAGIPATTIVAQQGVKAILTGICGPQPSKPLRKAGVDIIVGVTGRIRDAIEQFKAGGLKPMTREEEYQIPAEQSKRP